MSRRVAKPKRTLAERQRTDSANRYHAYTTGWRDGAGLRSMNVNASEHADEGIRDAYNAGYSAGTMSRNDANRAATCIYGHEPSILRIAEESP